MSVPRTPIKWLRDLSCFASMHKHNAVQLEEAD